MFQSVLILFSDKQTENPLFIEVIIASRSRFKALRALTVEGVVAEMDRQSQERKDRGTSDLVNSRGASFDSVLSPSSTRSPSMASVHEDDRFAIGGEDDEEDIGDTQRPTSLSEKARGKQPEATARVGTSREMSTSSLQSLTMPMRDGLGGGFRPSQPWLESWYSRLPLEPIFEIIEAAENRSATKPLPSGVRADIGRASVDGRPAGLASDDVQAGKFCSDRERETRLIRPRRR